MQKTDNHKSVTPIPPPLNQRFRRGLLGEELKKYAEKNISASWEVASVA